MSSIDENDENTSGINDENDNIDSNTLNGQGNGDGSSSNPRFNYNQLVNDNYSNIMPHKVKYFQENESTACDTTKKSKINDPKETKNVLLNITLIS
jgi:hypothetical protein